MEKYLPCPCKKITSSLIYISVRISMMLTYNKNTSSKL